MLFLRWFATSPRPALQNPDVMTLAAQHDWIQRAAVLDHRLNRGVRPLVDVTNQIAADSVSILAIELEAMAAACRDNPGRQRLRDITPLLQLIATMGGFGALKDGSDGEQSDLDWDAVTPDERAVLMKALPIFERRRKRK